MPTYPVLEVMCSRSTPDCWNTILFPPVVLRTKEFKPPKVVMAPPPLLNAIVGPLLLCKASIDIGEVVPIPTLPSTSSPFVGAATS